MTPETAATLIASGVAPFLAAGHGFAQAIQEAIETSPALRAALSGSGAEPSPRSKPWPIGIGFPMRQEDRRGKFCWVGLAETPSGAPAQLIETAFQRSAFNNRDGSPRVCRLLLEPERRTA